MSWLTSKPIAHRGLHKGTEIPENSLPAFEAAVKKGYPVEMDVHLLASGEIIVFHDDTLERTTGHNGITCEQNFSRINSLRLFNTDYKIPLLKDVLSLIHGQVPLLIEIKNKYKVGPFESELKKILVQYKGDFAVQSFNPFSLEWFKHNRPEILRGQLSGNFPARDILWVKNIILRRLLLNYKSDPDFIAYDFHCLPYTWVAREVRKRRIPLLTWTVKNAIQRDEALKKADNIIFEGFEA